MFIVALSAFALLPAAQAQAAYTVELGTLPTLADGTAVVQVGNGLTVPVRVLSGGTGVASAKLEVSQDGVRDPDLWTNGAGQATRAFYQGSATGAKVMSFQLSCVFSGSTCATASADPASVRILWTEIRLGVSVPASAHAGDLVDVVAYANWTGDGHPVAGLQVQFVEEGVHSSALTDANGMAFTQMTVPDLPSVRVQAGADASDWPFGIYTYASAIKTLSVTSASSASTSSTSSGTSGISSSSSSTHSSSSSVPPRQGSSRSPGSNTATATPSTPVTEPSADAGERPLPPGFYPVEDTLSQPGDGLQVISDTSTHKTVGLETPLVVLLLFAFAWGARRA